VSHSFEFVAAPPDLAPYLNSLYIWRSPDDRLDDVLPAYSGQMVVFGRGVGRMQFDGGEVAETSDAFFLAPLCQARNFSVSGPATLFGVSLNFRGWAALSSLSVHDYHDCFLHPKWSSMIRLRRPLPRWVGAGGRANWGIGNCSTR